MKKLSVIRATNINIVLILSAIVLILPELQKLIEGLFPEAAAIASTVIAFLLAVVAIVIKVFFTETPTE